MMSDHLHERGVKLKSSVGESLSKTTKRLTDAEKSVYQDGKGIQREHLKRTNR